FSNDQVKNAVSLQASQMLAADLVLSNNEPLDTKWQKKAEQIGLKQTHVTMFSSMAHTQDQFVMVNVKAIEPAFPLRGKLEIEPSAQSIQPG
ncbi:ABC transporter permease, partial [Acinetobacter baumannii]